MRRELRVLMMLLGAACAAPAPASSPPTADSPPPRTAAALETSSPTAAGVPPPATSAPTTAPLPANGIAALEPPSGVQTAVAVLGAAGPKPPPEHVDPRALAADPAGQVGKRVVVQGQVARVVEQGAQRWVEVLAQPRGETTIQTVDVMLETDALVEREACYRMVGVAAGTDALSRAFVGSTRDLPLVLVTEVEAAPLGPYGIGCAPP